MINHSALDQYVIKNHIVSIIYQSVKYKESRPNACYQPSSGKLSTVLDMTRIFGDDWSHMNGQLFAEGTLEANYRAYVKTQPNTTINLLKMLAVQIELLNQTNEDRYYLAQEWVSNPVSLTQSIQAVMMSSIQDRCAELKKVPQYEFFSSFPEERVASEKENIGQSIKAGISRLIDYNHDLVHVYESINSIRKDYPSFFDTSFFAQTQADDVERKKLRDEMVALDDQTDIECLNGVFRARLKNRIISEYVTKSGAFDRNRLLLDADAHGIKHDSIALEALASTIAEKRLQNIATIINVGALRLAQMPQKENTQFQNDRLNAVYIKMDQGKYIDTQGLAKAIQLDPDSPIDIHQYCMPELADSYFIDYAKSCVDSLYAMLVLQNTPKDGFSFATYALETVLTEIRLRPWDHNAAICIEDAVAGLTESVKADPNVDYAQVLRLAVLDSQKRFLENYMVKMDGIARQFKTDLMMKVHQDLKNLLERYRQIEGNLLRSLSSQHVDADQVSTYINILADINEKMHGLYVVGNFKFGTHLPLQIPRGNESLLPKELIMFGHLNHVLNVLNQGLQKIEDKILRNAQYSSRGVQGDEEKMAQWGGRYMGLVNAIKELHKMGNKVTSPGKRDTDYPIIESLGRVIALLDKLIVLNKETKMDSKGVAVMNEALAAVKDMRSELRAHLEAIRTQLIKERDIYNSHQKLHHANALRGASSASSASGATVSFVRLPNLVLNPVTGFKKPGQSSQN